MPGPIIQPAPQFNSEATRAADLGDTVTLAFLGGTRGFGPTGTGEVTNTLDFGSWGP